MATATKKNSFADLFAQYKTYDPKKEGYGSAAEWSETFYTRMGFEEAEEILFADNDTLRGILGVGPKAKWDEIKKAFRAMVMKCHPDRAIINNMDPKKATELFKKVTAAFTILEREFGK